MGHSVKFHIVKQVWHDYKKIYLFSTLARSLTFFYFHTNNYY